MPQLEQLVWRAAAIVALCAPLYACEREGRQLDAQAMARQLHTLSSLSAEGAFVAGELRSGHLKPSFVSTHIDNLAEDANTARREIARPAPPALQRQHAQARALADQLAQALRDTAMAQGGADARMEHAQQTFLRLKFGFDALGKSL